MEVTSCFGMFLDFILPSLVGVVTIPTNRVLAYLTKNSHFPDLVCLLLLFSVYVTQLFHSSLRDNMSSLQPVLNQEPDVKKGKKRNKKKKIPCRSQEV